MPKYLDLKGTRLECYDVMPIGMLFDLAEAMDSDNMVKAVAVMSRTVKNLVKAEERPRLEQILHDVADPLSFDDLNTALGTLIPEYTQRPSQPASPSQAGPSTTGGTSKRVSLWPDAAERSSQGGTPVAS